MKTRQDYLENRCTHKEYYDQFVTPEIKQAVLKFIGLERLQRSTDEHLNDINLRAWDAISLQFKQQLRELLKSAGDFWSLASGVCTAKAAARQIIAENSGPKPTLFDDIKAAGIPFASHESDLYVPNTPQVREILDKYPTSKANARTFYNQVEGGVWIDIPFAYLPFWEARQRTK